MCVLRCPRATTSRSIPSSREISPSLAPVVVMLLQVRTHADEAFGVVFELLFAKMPCLSSSLRLTLRHPIPITVQKQILHRALAWQHQCPLATVYTDCKPSQPALAPGKGVVEFLVGSKRSNYSTPVYLFIVFLVSIVLWGVMPWIISAYAELNLEERVAMLEAGGGGGSGAALSASAMQELQRLKSEVEANLEAMKGVKAEVEGKIDAFKTAQVSFHRVVLSLELL